MDNLELRKTERGFNSLDHSFRTTHLVFKKSKPESDISANGFSTFQLADTNL